MGNQHSFDIENYDFPRPNSMSFWRNTPAEPINKHRVGNVYIMVHKTREQERFDGDLTYMEEKRAHHSLMVDVAGASNDAELRGVWFHLTADIKTRDTEFCALGEPVPRSSLIRYSRPDPNRLRPPEDVSNPQEWALLLKNQAERVYAVLTNFGSLPWSDTVNCQQYVRKLVESFGLKVGNDIQLAGDVWPIIVDVAIFIISKQKMKEETNAAPATN